MSAATSIGPRSAELQSPVPGVPADANLKVALFSDVGSLWATGASSVSELASLSPSQQIANSQRAARVGRRRLIWDSPFGPMQVDYAYPIAKQPYDVTQRFNSMPADFDARSDFAAARPRESRKLHAALYCRPDLRPGY